jgi:hypothetical protein
LALVTVFVNVYLTISIRGKNMESKNIVGMSVLGLTFLLGAQGAMAQVATQPQGVPFGSFVLVPTLNVKTVSDDNIYGLSSNEVSSFSQILNPNLAFIAQDRLNVYRAVYNLNAASYANDSNDSYADQSFDLSAHLEPSVRLRFDSGLAYRMLHDDRGSGRTSGQGLTAILASGEVDKYDVASIRGGVEYGAATARGLIVFTVDMSQKRYARDFVAFGRDNDTLSSLLGLRARVMPKTTLLVDYEYTDTNYKTDLVKGGTADTQDNRILAGVSWENTAQTTGKLRLGQGKRAIEAGADINKFTWDLGVIWKPVVLDTININGGARASDATAPYTSVENTNYSLSWTHDWLDRFNTTISLGSSKDDYKGVTPARSDDSKNYGLSANYQMRRWLTFNAGINVTDRSSNAAGFANKRNVMSVGAQVSL